MKLKQLLIDHRENLQLTYGVFLIVLIPLLIICNTFFIINRYNENTDRDLQLKMRLTGRTIYADLQDDLANEVNMQTKIEKIAKRNSELENLAVLIPQDDNYKIIASSNKEEIGKTLTFYFYQNAWSQPDNDGLITNSLLLATATDGQEMGLSSENNGRFWIMAMPMRDLGGNKKAILSIRMSSEIVDELTNQSKNESLVILLLTILITVLFLAITVRLWDYAILYRKIKEVDQMKDEFISIASHELRTPLTSIKGYTSMIAEGTFGKIENAEMRKSLDRIISSSKRLEALVEDLLDVSRLEQGRLLVEKQNVRIGPIIEEIVSQLSINAKEKKLDLIYEKPENALPEIFTDSERIKQVLTNLIGNAIKYTETGNVTVSNEAKNNSIYIKVTDTGIGISPEAQKSLFQKFYRVKTNKTENISGTGLGLWITKKIVELMGGKIYLESIEGRGTQVTVVLPLTKTDGKK